MDSLHSIPELPMLQSSKSPDSSEGIAQLTRWQRLRTLAQTKSLLPAAAASDTIAMCSNLDTGMMASSPIDQLAAQSQENLALILRQPGKLAAARARTMLQSQQEIAISDSLDADLQVDAVLRKAAARAVHLAGFPKVFAAHGKVALGQGTG